MAAKAPFQLSPEASSSTFTTTLNNLLQKTMIFLKFLAKSPEVTAIPSSYVFKIKKEEILED